jgi:hypothetical protein
VGVFFTIYVAGVAIGLWRADAPPARRIGLALLWPVAVAACVVTLTTLSIAAVVLFPLVGVALVGGATGLWWMMR